MAPRARSARAMAWPMPPVAPVSSTVEPGSARAVSLRPCGSSRCSDPTGVGKTAVAIAAGGAAARAGARTRSRSRPTRCRSTRAWRCSPGWPRRRARRALEHRLVSFLALDATFSAGRYARLAHARDRRPAGHGQAPDRGGRDGPVPARGAHRPGPEAGATGGRDLDGELECVERRRCTHCSASGRRGRRRHRPPRWRRLVRALELSDLGELEPPEGRRSFGATMCATRRCWWG